MKKKDGGLRLCVDYRRLNSVSKVDAYPMPRVDEMLDRLGAAKYLSTLDLTRGYWQVPVKEGDQQKTAFTTPFGLYQFRRMPFGLQGAPATFQRMMDRLLDGMKDFADAYIDDLVIFTATWEEHLRCLRVILEKLRRVNLTVKRRKCQFGMGECSYLGHVIGGGWKLIKLKRCSNFRGLGPRRRSEHSWDSLDTIGSSFPTTLPLLLH